VAALDTDHSVTDSTKSVAASFQKLPDSIVKAVSRIRCIRSRCTRPNDDVIDQFVLNPWFFLHFMYIKDKRVLAFNFVFDLLWTDSSSLVSSVAF